MTPYYDADGITIYHADVFTMLPLVRGDVLVTDPPYGIAYRSNRPRVTLAASIEGDADASLRDAMLEWWRGHPALVFGSYRVERPVGWRMELVWDTKGALGMGALDLPWKPSSQRIYVIGTGFKGRRTSDVLTYAPVQSMARNGRLHPHQKPVDLMRDLISKCPPGVIVDPFMGSGSTLRAAKDLGRRAIGIEIEERYCEIAAKRLSQQVLDLGGVA